MTTKYLNDTPSEYVNWMTAPGLHGNFPFDVPLKQYLCAVGEYGGNVNAMALRAAVLAVAKARGRSIRDEIEKSNFDRIFTGQGRPEDQTKLMDFIWEFADDFLAYPGPKKTYPFKKYLEYKVENPFPKMVADKMFGLDCIGFVGNYFMNQAVFKGWPGLYPRQYLDRFLPVKSIDEIITGCVLVWVKGTHIALIDAVWDRPSQEKVRVDICQSSKGGPQKNLGVVLAQSGGVEYIEFGAYGKEAVGKSEAELKDLRKKYTTTGSTGYRGGIFFKIHHLGSPAAPVPGYVYIGRMPDLKFVFDQ